MERDELFALVLQVVLDQGGDREAVFAVLRRDLPAEDVEQAVLMGLVGLSIFEEHFSPELGVPRSGELLRDMIARRRARIPVAAARPSAWWRRRSA
jgi:hypothetical protein